MTSALSNETVALQYLRFKGSLLGEELTRIARTPADALLDQPWAEWVTRDGDNVRLSTAGRSHLDVLLMGERSETDLRTLRDYYESQFLPANMLLKAVVTEWQLLPDGRLNGHQDAEYDRRIIERLDSIVRNYLSTSDVLHHLVPRLAIYSERLRYAMQESAAGDHSYVLRPLLDSIHTVWFELHQELLDLLGIDRASEDA